MSLKDRAWLRGFGALGFGPAALAVIRQGAVSSCCGRCWCQTRCCPSESSHRLADGVLGSLVRDDHGSALFASGKTEKENIR